MSEAAGRLRALFSPALPLAAAYFLLLLPFERMGYLNSLLSRVEIPAFVLGELQLTHAGVALILAFHALVLAAFYLLIFVPIRMLLGQSASAPHAAAARVCTGRWAGGGRFGCWRPS